MYITQKHKIIKKLLINKSVNNFWAINNYILRLGAIIHRLKKEGWVFDGQFGVNKNKHNYSYCLLKKPKNFNYFYEK